MLRRMGKRRRGVKCMSDDGGRGCGDGVEGRRVGWRKRKKVGGKGGRA